jgi:hypothetical protein
MYYTIVTRLGEFSPIGRFRRSKNILLFFHQKSYVCINFDKKVFGYILGDFFHKFIWSPCKLPTRLCGMSMSRKKKANGSFISDAFFAGLPDLSS